MSMAEYGMTILYLFVSILRIIIMSQVLLGCLKGKDKDWIIAGLCVFVMVCDIIVIGLSVYFLITFWI